MATSRAPRVANIGASERRKRLVFGFVAFGAGAVIAILLILVHAPVIWRLPLFLLFLPAALGVFQSRDKT
jgi:hypothetical protein